jgi:hypothetical protein
MELLTNQRVHTYRSAKAASRDTYSDKEESESEENDENDKNSHNVSPPAKLKRKRRERVVSDDSDDDETKRDDVGVSGKRRTVDSPVKKRKLLGKQSTKGAGLLDLGVENGLDLDDLL